MADACITLTDDQGGFVSFYPGSRSYTLSLTARHLCGLSGFNPMLGDKCPACDQGEALMKLARRAEGEGGQP